MTQSESEQHKPREACGLACQSCGSHLLVSGALHRAHETAHTPDGPPLENRDPFQLITAAAWGEAAREASDLILLCGECHKLIDADGVDISKLVELETRQAEHVLVKALAEAANSLKPTSFEIKLAVRRAQLEFELAVQHFEAERTKLAAYVLNYFLIETTLGKWRQAAHGDLHPRNVLLGRDEVPSALELAEGAAHSAWSAAVELRELYLSPDVSMATRNEAVAKFATDQLGWSINAPELRKEALIDVLLGDDWRHGPDAPADDFSTVLKRLIGRQYQGWKPYHEGQISGMAITSHSVTAITENGESVEILSLLAGPDITLGDEPHVTLVKNALAELEPLEREVCLTYATCTGRKSWKKAAQLNGLPESFGVNGVRRKIKARLREYEDAGRACQRTPRR